MQKKKETRDVGYTGKVYFVSDGIQILYLRITVGTQCQQPGAKMIAY